MVRVFNVAEKPSVAKEISRILSDGVLSTRNGFSKYNPIYIFECPINNLHSQMIFTSVTGHLISSDFSEEYKRWTSCDPIMLFDAPIKRFVPPDKINLKRTLQQEIRSCDWLILWLDCDREGENIAFEVLQVCHEVKQNIRIFRAHFSALVPGDIRRALFTLTPPNSNLSDAVDARQEIDLRIGAAFTRFQTMRLQRRFDTIVGVVSYGPCQFPTLGFVVERYLQRRDFIPEPFWYISCRYQSPHDGSITTFNWCRYRLFDRPSCLVLFDMCKRDTTAIVTELNTHPTRRYKPYPLATVDFQKMASIYLHITAERAMQIAEVLYTKGMISYPRTETDVFVDSMNLRDIIRLQTESNQWGNYAQLLLSEGGGFSRPRAGKHNDNAHPPIHPTRFTDQFQNNDERRVYDLITRRFLACCSKDAIGLQTDMTIKIGIELFHTKGLIITERNFLDIYPFMRWNEDTVPDFHQGDTFHPTFFTLEESQTIAPSLLSEHMLIKKMDENGIGTDATIATHIEMIKTRNYCEIRNEEFHPTTLGLSLVIAYDTIGITLSKPELRANMEEQMRLIAEGHQTKAAFLSSCIDQMRGIYQQFISNASLLDSVIGYYFPSRGDKPSNGNENNRSSSILSHSDNNGVTFRGIGRGRGKSGSMTVCNDQYLHLSPPSPRSRGGNKAKKAHSNKRGGNLSERKVSNSVTCFKCGQPGHYVTSCPNTQSSSSTFNSGESESFIIGRGSRGRNKFNSDKQTQSVSNSDQVRGRGRGSVICYVCKKYGHYATTCPIRYSKAVKTSGSKDSSKKRSRSSKENINNTNSSSTSNSNTKQTLGNVRKTRKTPR